MKTLFVNKLMTVFLVISMFAFTHFNLIAQTSLPAPETFFGFKPGADRMLFDYETLIQYFRKLDEASPRVRMVEIGNSPMGKKMYIVFVSSGENINRLDTLRKINEQLAMNPDIGTSDRNVLLAEGRVFLLATLSMHSDEVGPTQASPLIAYKLAKTQDRDTLEWIRNVVLMIVPNHNPDGMDMVVNHYRKYKGTKYETSSLPAVYHKYVGHDNNRDFVMLSQEDTKAIAAIYNKIWFPQVMVEKHQMGSNGPRYFVPPPHDPIAENVDAELWNWMWIFGSGMARDMVNSGLKGVSQHYTFDDYWPGSTETCDWKNVIGLLTECASAGVATPMYTEPNELVVGGKGLGDYKKSINMTEPWPGGWWKLSDIIDYEMVSTFSIMKTASIHRNEILAFRNDLCSREVTLGRNKAPYFYILPLEQHDKSELVNLANLLDEHGIKVYRLKEDIYYDGHLFKKGDIVVPLAQPFRGFIKEVMEKQVFPARHYVPKGEVIKPYDIASWCLPLHKGVQSYAINKPGLDLSSEIEQIVFPFSLVNPDKVAGTQLFFTVNNNESFKAAFHALAMGLKVSRLKESITVSGTALPAGSFMIMPGKRANELLKDLTIDPVFPESVAEVNAVEIAMPRIGLVETNMHDMDAGWTRFIFDSYSIPFTVIRPGDFGKLKPSEKFDMLIFPDNSKSVLMEGKYKVGAEYYPTDYPPEFTKGIGKDGSESILKFLDNGGKIISWGGSVDLFMGPLSLKLSETDSADFQLPVTNIAETLGKEGLYCPGSLMEVNLVPGTSFSLGLKEKMSVFFQGNAVFTTSQPVFDTDRRMIASFPETDILLSGYCEKEEKLSNRTAMVWVKKGKGQLVLYAFDPIFRASVPASYKLLFNALLMQ